MTWLAVAIGGSLGALCRYWIATYYFTAVGKFPWATLSANILGCLLMGLCYVVIVEKSIIDASLRPLLMTGFLGAMTTFSTFALDAVLLWQQGHATTALLYVVVSVISCLFALAGSILLASKFI